MLWPVMLTQCICSRFCSNFLLVFSVSAMCHTTHSTNVGRLSVVKHVRHSDWKTDLLILQSVSLSMLHSLPMKQLPCPPTFSDFDDPEEINSPPSSINLQLPPSAKFPRFFNDWWTLFDRQLKGVAGISNVLFLKNHVLANFPSFNFF